MKIISTLLATLLIGASVSFGANAAGTAEVTPNVKPSTTAAMSDGEVKKVDKDAGKITIKHGPLVNLDMQGMTMAFRVKDPAMLTKVKAGDKIKFIANLVNGALTVTTLEVEK